MQTNSKTEEKKVPKRTPEDLKYARNRYIKHTASTELTYEQLREFLDNLFDMFKENHKVELTYLIHTYVAKGSEFPQWGVTSETVPALKLVVSNKTLSNRTIFTTSLPVLPGISTNRVSSKLLVNLVYFLSTVGIAMVNEKATASPAPPAVDPYYNDKD
jgi:hypothetical protein